jgi:6-pyruvoyl-tetrahydropterin synthase
MLLKKSHIKFCSAHTLRKIFGNNHKCSNLHGHNYYADVIIECNTNNPIIIDLGEIDEIIKRIDHKCLNRLTLQDYHESLKAQNFDLNSITTTLDKVILENGIEGLQGIMEDGSDCPTVENISRWIANEVENRIKKADNNLISLSITVYETETSLATEHRIYV